MSSVLRWWAEAGWAGLAVAVVGLLWCLARLPTSLGRVGTADRTLAFGALGAAFAFAALSVLHWTTDLTAVAIAASAFGGTMNRWLAGGTDLFVERA